MESSKMGSNDGFSARKRVRDEHPEVLHKKKKRKSHEAESNDLSAVQPELLPKPELTATNALEKKKKRKKRKHDGLNCEEAEPHKLNAEPSQLCPKPEPLPPIDLEKKKRKRKEKKKSAPNPEGAQSNEPNEEHPELRPKPEPSPSLKPDSQIPAVPEPTNPTDLEKKKNKRKKKKKSVPNHEGAQSNELNAERPELCPKPEPIRPIDSDTEMLPEPEPTSPVDTDQKKTKKRKERKKKNALKCEETESNELVANATETPVQRLEGLGVSKIPSKIPGENHINPIENYTRCVACRQLGHIVRKCPRVKALKMNEAICFYCGEIGHSLGICPQSPGGRSKFAIST